MERQLYNLYCGGELVETITYNEVFDSIIKFADDKTPKIKVITIGYELYVTDNLTFIEMFLKSFDKELQGPGVIDITYIEFETYEEAYSEALKIKREYLIYKW